MSTAPTPKELVKAVVSFARAPSLPLPEDLVHLIETFLYNRAEKWDENITEKVHDELLSIFKHDISHEPARYAAFVALLRHLRPLIGQPTKVLQWFELLLPVLNHLGRERDLASETQRIVIDILTEGDGKDANSLTRGAAGPIAEKMICLWFQEAELLRNSADALQDYKEKHLRETLLLYGKKRPKDFMAVIDRFLRKKSHRASSLLLISSFVQSQPPHLYLILETPLFGNLLNCLQRDTSTTIISLALTVLTMVIPHTPSSLVPHLPTLFNIYARLLFWERELSIHATTKEDKEQGSFSNTLDWEVCPFSPDVDDKIVSQLLNYFTILYGLYPINFMDYIRKPQRYLRHAEVPDADVIEVQPTEIRHASERFRQCHLLHENFYTLTIDSEKADFGRWIKSDPAEVVANCIALRQLPDEPPDTISHHLAKILRSDDEEIDKDDKESGLLSDSVNIGTSGQGDPRRSSSSSFSQRGSSSRISSTVFRHPSQGSHQSKRESLSTRLSENDSDSPTISRQLTTSGSQTQLQDLINPNTIVKSSLHQSFPNDSVPSLSQHRESITEKASSQLHVDTSSLNMQLPENAVNHKETRLVGYIYLLYNDLVFERFLKQQHLNHIGGLRRQHVREAASEAETLNIITANKHLKQRLEEAKKAEIQAKTEAEKSRTLAKKWEVDLFNKLKALREEQRKWDNERSTLQAELKAVKDEAEDLRTLVCEVEVRELRLKQNKQSAEINFGELERLRSEVARLTASERHYQSKEAARQEAMTQAVEADSRAQAAVMELGARESEFKQIRDAYQSQITMLNSRLQETLRIGGQLNAESFKARLSAEFEASRAMQAEMKERIHELSRKNTELQKRIFMIEAQVPIPSTDTEDELSLSSSSPPGPSNRRDLSESELIKAVLYNTTPPPGPPRPNSTQARPSTSQGPGESSTSTSGSSPTTERYFSRGASQRSRRDRKEGEEKGGKKSIGRRGIRGFV